MKSLHSVVVILLNAHFASTTLHGKRENSLRGLYLARRGEGGNSTSTNEPSFKLNFTGQCRKYQRRCQICEGDCETDSDCAEGLGCFIRDSKTPSEQIPVPGCLDNPRYLYAKDFCYNKTLSPCQDISSFNDNNGTSRQCSWVAENQTVISRCEKYGHYCRQTCGYCRS